MKTLSEASRALELGKVSSVELTEGCLDAIKQKDAELGAYLEVDAQGALKSAQESDARRQGGQSLGPLDGVPIGIKDIIFCKGLESTAASKILEGYKAPYDAMVIQKLKAAGAVILGKTNQDEFAMGASGEHSAYKVTRNPHDLNRTPGGSSSGSAVAVAAGMGYGSLGTDTGGSVRQPAALTGIVGIKPTYGRVSRYGVIAFASSLDQIGAFGSSVEDAALMLQGIAGYDPRDSTSVDRPVPDYRAALKGDVRGKRIGVPKEFFSEGLEPEVKASVQEAIGLLEKQGVEVKEVSLPHASTAIATYYIICTAEASSNLARFDGIRYGPRKGDQEGLNALYEKTRGELFGDEVQRRILLGTYILSAGYYDAYYVRAQKVRALIAKDFSEVFKEVDAIVGPTTPTTAYKIGENIQDPLAEYLGDIYTAPVNLAGLPGISVPGKPTKKGLPVGVQFIAKPFEESLLLNLGYALEGALKDG